MKCLSLLMGITVIITTYAHENTYKQDLATSFNQAIKFGNVKEIKNIIAQDFDVNEKYLGFPFLRNVLLEHFYYQTSLELLELLLEADAQWPYTVEDSLVINNVEIIRQETMTQFLKSHWMINCTQNLRFSFHCKQLIPFVDALELKYKRKEKSDLLFMHITDQNLSNVDICCKQAAYYELFADIEQGNIAGLKATLALGIDPNYRNHRGISVLFHTFTFIPFLASDIGLEIVKMLLNTGAQWSPDHEFKTLLDDELATGKPGTMTNWMLQSADLYSALKQNNIHDHLAAQKYDEYMKRCKTIASFLDDYELKNNLKDHFEII